MVNKKRAVKTIMEHAVVASYFRAYERYEMNKLLHTYMLLKPAVLKGSLATGLGVGAGPGVPGDPVLSVNNSFCFILAKIFNTEKQIVFHQ